MPATCGVAMLVPDSLRYRLGIGNEEYTFTPGPTRLTSPPLALIVRFEKFAIRKFSSTAPTAMMDGQFAGAPTGRMTPCARSLSLPAAAMIRQPRLSALRAAVSYAMGGGSPGATARPSDIEITGQPFATAQLIPASIQPSVPEPLLLRTLPINIRDS